MLYTRKGDKGTTKTLRGEARVSKASTLAEALGTLDEVNSFVGIVKLDAQKSGFYVGTKTFAEILRDIQQNLFIVQAECAGAKKSIELRKVTELEEITDAAEKSMPPITSFFVSGGTELAARLDFARTLARRAERRVIAVVEEGVVFEQGTLAYLNRLSSLLYALARLSNYKAGVAEEVPTYR